MDQCVWRNELLTLVVMTFLISSGFRASRACCNSATDIFLAVAMLAMLKITDLRSAIYLWPCPIWRWGWIEAKMIDLRSIKCDMKVKWKWIEKCKESANRGADCESDILKRQDNWSEISYVLRERVRCECKLWCRLRKWYWTKAR